MSAQKNVVVVKTGKFPQRFVRLKISFRLVEMKDSVDGIGAV